MEYPVYRKLKMRHGGLVFRIGEWRYDVIKVCEVDGFDVDYEYHLVKKGTFSVISGQQVTEKCFLSWRADLIRIKDESSKEEFDSLLLKFKNIINGLH